VGEYTDIMDYSVGSRIRVRLRTNPQAGRCRSSTATWRRRSIQPRLPKFYRQR